MPLLGSNQTQHRRFPSTFEGQRQEGRQWLLVDGDVVDLCREDPGKDVDLYVSSKVRTVVKVWEGDLDLRTALRSGAIKAHGARHLVRTMPDWFGVCLYKDIRRGDPRLMRRAAD